MMLTKLLQRSRQTFGLDVQGVSRTLRTDDRQTLLDAMLREKVAINHLCLVGECGSCRCRLVSGRVKLKRDISAVIDQADLARGHLLACQSLALSDVEIAVPGLGGEAPADEPAVAATISGMRRLADNVIELTLSPERPITYRAGQFARLTFPEISDLAGITRCYSFADAPGEEDHLLRFHVRHVPGGRFTDWLFAADRSGVRLAIAGTSGDFGYHASDRPIVCIAGGTGLAPIRAILRNLAGAGRTPDVTLMLAARSQRDLYGIDDIGALASQWKGQFALLPVLSEEPASSEWQGRRGFCTEYLAELGDLSAQDFYLCGPPAMIDAVTEQLRDVVPDTQIHIDRFLDQSTDTQASI